MPSTAVSSLQFDRSEFRRVLGHWTTGVAVVTTNTPDGRPCGLTANALSSVSLDPPLVLVCVQHDADTYECIEESRTFAINVLRSDQERIARRFATFEIDRKFEGIAYHAGASGAPILDDALAWMDCRVYDSHIAGDHTIYVGEVLDGGAEEGLPLVYYRSGYGRFLP